MTIYWYGKYVKLTNTEVYWQLICKSGVYIAMGSHAIEEYLCRGPPSCHWLQSLATTNLKSICVPPINSKVTTDSKNIHISLINIKQYPKYNRSNIKPNFWSVGIDHKYAMAPFVNVNFNGIVYGRVLIIYTSLDTYLSYTTQ